MLMPLMPGGSCGVSRDRGGRPLQTDSTAAHVARLAEAVLAEGPIPEAALGRILARPGTSPARAVVRALDGLEARGRLVWREKCDHDLRPAKRGITYVGLL